MSALVNNVEAVVKKDMTQASHSTTIPTNAGPHSFNIANKLDPTVDSDMDHRANPTSRIGGKGTHALANTGTAHGATTVGSHSSTLMNKLDPRVDSDMDHRAKPASCAFTGTTGSSITGIASSKTPGSGAAKNTAGPHNSDLFNKLDPRVDSDLDGSKTVGGNATYK